MKNLLFLFLFFPALIFGKEYKPEEIINPNIEDRTQYVADPEGLLDKEAKREVNELLWNLRKNTGAEVAMVIVPNTGELTEEDFATEIFDNWKIGKADKDNGVLILIVTDQRAARIATGYGVEGIIPDISAIKIIRRSIIPHMKEGDLDGAAVAVATDVANILSSPEAAEELKSSQGEAWENTASPITSEMIFNFLFIVVLAVALIAYITYFIDRGRLKKKDRYNQARGWQNDINTYLWFGILSLGLGSIPYFLVKKRYNKLRNAPMSCPACRGRMNKLNEEEDNNLLSPSQDLEEKLNSVDYDVWVCEDCGTVERYAFPNKHSVYQECPHCHTKAMYLMMDHTIRPATTRSSGLGEKIYDCKYCNNKTRKKYTLPRLASATVLPGSMGSSGRGGFGGGFGGGMTGGGGATGRW